MFRLIIPLVAGHTLLSKCPRPEETTEPVQNSIRELMWPVLLVAMGFSWYSARAAAKNGGLQVDGAFGGLLAMMLWWMHTHFCKNEPDQAKLILVLVAAATGFVTYIAGTHNATAAIMLLPMLVWLLFAERLQIPKIRIKLPSINIKLPSIRVAKNGGPAISVDTQTAPAPAPAPEKPTQTSDGVPKASTSTPVPPKVVATDVVVTSPLIVADVVTSSPTQPPREGFRW